VTFALDSSRVVASTTRSVAAADVNGDGKVDLIYASFVPTDAPRIPGRLTVLLNNGNGTFSTSGDYAVGVLPWFVTSADVNGDGRPDLISANYRTSNGMSTLSVLLGISNFPPTKPAIRTSGNDVITSRPPSLWGLTLQPNSDLTTTNWSACGGLADDGTNKGLTVPSPKGSLFFRLAYP
jgi:hypothetical protein